MINESPAINWSGMLRAIVSAGARHRALENFKQSEIKMENSPQQPTAAGSLKQPTKINQVERMTCEIRQVVEEMEQRLQLVVDRLDGTRPTEAHQETAVDMPGILGSINSQQDKTRRDLDRCLGWLNEIEQLV